MTWSTYRISFSSAFRNTCILSCTEEGKGRGVQKCLLQHQYQKLTPSTKNIYDQPRYNISHVRVTHSLVPSKAMKMFTWPPNHHFTLLSLHKGNRKRYSNPITGLDRPRGFQEVEAPRFQDNWQMKVVRLWALRSGCLYRPGMIPGTRFC
jgi:hypothetical protein